VPDARWGAEARCRIRCGFLIGLREAGFVLSLGSLGARGAPDPEVERQEASGQGEV
jgi:hypothetical protein